MLCSKIRDQTLGHSWLIPQCDQEPCLCATALVRRIQQIRRYFFDGDDRAIGIRNGHGYSTCASLRCDGTVRCSVRVRLDDMTTTMSSSQSIFNDCCA